MTRSPCGSRLSPARPTAGTWSPAASARSRWPTLVNQDQAGADLTGINLAAALVAGGDWAGADLTDSDLRLANLSASFAGADLTDVRAAGARLGGDFTGAVLVRADLTGASAPLAILAGDTGGARLRDISFDVPLDQPRGVSFRGLDVRGASFRGPFDGIGDLRGVDFREANLGDAAFWNVDLTDAVFKGAKLGHLVFYGDITCPDGKAARAGDYSILDCSIKR